MKFSQDFIVAAPLERVWALFQDVPEVVECLPGATLTEALGDDRFKGDVAVKLGPVAARFEGVAEHTADESARSGVIQGKGTDKKGGSRTQATIGYRLEEAPEGTKVTVDSDITLSGRAAQFGRPGLIREMTGRIIQDFGKNLESKLAEGDAPQEDAGSPPAEAAPRQEVSGFSLLFASLLNMLKRWLRGG